MNKTFITLFLCAMTSAGFAQTTSYFVPPVMQFGKIDQTELELKACDFEKDANAEVLFNKATVSFGPNLLTITEDVHKRIKIFNDQGKGEANIHISVLSFDKLEYISGLQAETVNLVDGKPEITKLDKKLIYTKNIDKIWSEITFSMPNVKPGSVIEFKYTWNSATFLDFPNWFFQEKIPVKYSELNTSIPDVFYYRAMPHMMQDLTISTSNNEDRTLLGQKEDRPLLGQKDSYPYSLKVESRGMANVHSLPDEPYMSSFIDNVQSIRFQLVTIKPIESFERPLLDTWDKVSSNVMDNDDFGGQLKRKVNGEDLIINKAKTFKTDDEKIAYIFNEVKNTMKWNGVDNWFTYDGTYRAWENKTGNSAEVNLILYHLLKQSGIEVYPMMVSTREHGKIDPYYTTSVQFNRAVAYVPGNNTKSYVLDATGKYNTYNETPSELLNSSGLRIDKANNKYDFVDLKEDIPSKQIVLIDAQIKAGGKIEGTAEISSTSYNKSAAVERYKTDGEKKYIDYLRGNDNNLKISELKLENMDVDSLPLVQSIKFNLDLAGSDDNYIYLNPNIFTSLKTNPFLSENRTTDIDFAYKRLYAINSVYKIPAGYKADALPKSVTIVMPDKSFSFKRTVLEQEGTIVIRYVINYNAQEYPKDGYPDLHEFFKKMNDMLNEQIVLKKS